MSTINPECLDVALSETVKCFSRGVNTAETFFLCRKQDTAVGDVRVWWKVLRTQHQMLQEMKTIEDQIDKMQMEAEEKTRKASIAEILLVTENLL